MALFGGQVGTTGYQAPDYSGSIDAARGLAMTRAQGVASGINQVTDYFKQQGEKKKLIKQSDVQIDAALKLFPDLSPTLQGVRDQIKDENISLNERAQIAETVAGLINMGTNQMQAMAEVGLKNRELDIRKGQVIQEALARQAELEAQANKPNEMRLDTVFVGNNEVDVLVDDFGNIYDPATKLKIVDLPGYSAGKPLPNVTVEQPIEELPIGAGNAIIDGGVLPLPDNVPITGTPIATEPSSAEAIQNASELAVPASASNLQSRGRPRNQSVENKGTLMTPQQVQSLVAQGFRLNAIPLADGSFMVTGADIGGQAGETIETTPEGGVRIVRGSSGAKAEAAEAAQKEQSFERSRAIIGSASDAIGAIKSELSANPVIAKGQEAISAVFPASATGRIAEKLSTIKVQTSKEEIGKMRAASPTGSAGGNITENEWPRFENNFGTLEVGMNPVDLVSNLRKTALNQFEAVNGRPEEVVELFNNGKITKPVFDEYIKEYKKTRTILGIDDAGIGGPGDDWTAYNPNLLRFDKEKQNQLSPEARKVADELERLKNQN